VTGNQADVLAEGLDVVFCGINPAATAVAAGHNFSHRNNRFWAVLHLAGFTDRQLRPDDEHQLLQFGSESPRWWPGRPGEQARSGPKNSARHELASKRRSGGGDRKRWPSWASGPWLR